MCGNLVLPDAKGACWLGSNPIEYPLIFSFWEVDLCVNYVMSPCSCAISFRSALYYHSTYTSKSESVVSQLYPDLTC